VEWVLLFCQAEVEEEVEEVEVEEVVEVEYLREVEEAEEMAEVEVEVEEVPLEDCYDSDTFHFLFSHDSLPYTCRNLHDSF